MNGSEWFAQRYERLKNHPAYNTEGVAIVVGEQIYERMRAQGLSYEDVAKDANIKTDRLKSILGNGHDTTLAELVSIALVFGAEVKVVIE